MTPDLLFLLGVLSWGWQVDPAFALSVARVESGDKHHFIRFGPLGPHGKWAGPFCLDRAYCKEHFGVDPLLPEDNVRLGVRALRNTAGSESRMIRRLKIFNPEYGKNGYLADVLACYRKNKKEAEYGIKQSSTRATATAMAEPQEGLGR